VTTKTKTWLPLSLLLRGEAEMLRSWLQKRDAIQIAYNVLMIVIGAGCYGAAMGWWRDPRQALFVAIKFPLILLLTAVGNALINGMLAPLLGLNIPFRQSFHAILMSFTIAAAILGSFSPLIAFLVWNAPPISIAASSSATHAFIKLTHVAVIAFAGIAGNIRLFQLLVQLGGNKAVAWRVLFAWLAINLFLGSQLSWILRPFIGAPHLPVVFIRDTAFQGNFYENVFQTVKQLLSD
jgi:hypothetical protein